MRSNSENNVANQPWFACALIFVLPILASILVVTTSPNYRLAPSNLLRESPVGGDFLQEWIGGHIVSDGQASRLYDDRWTRELQHDPSLLGFGWDEREYYPMVYPPFYYWLVSPLASLSLPTAATIWCLLNALAFSTGLACLAFHLRERLGNWIWLGAICCFFHPLLLSLNMGQKSGFLLLILVSNFILLRSGKSFSAGVVFGLIVFKPHLALVIGPAMLLKQQYRFAAGAMLPVSLALVASVSLGAAACGGFWHVCTGAISYADNAGYSLADAHNLWGACKLLIPDSVSGLRTVVATILVALIVWCLWRCLRGKFDTLTDKFSLQYSAMILATILLSPHFFTYDLGLLLIPMLLIGSSFAVARSTNVEQVRPQLAHGWVICIVFVASGLFASFSATTGFPFSVAMLCVWMWLLFRDLNPRLKLNDAQTVRDSYSAKSPGICRRKTIAATIAPANGPIT